MDVRPVFGVCVFGARTRYLLMLTLLTRFVHLPTRLIVRINIFKGTVLCKQGPLQKFVRPYRFDGAYSNLHRDRDHTSVVLEYWSYPS